MKEPMAVRPSQIMCLICRYGAGKLSRAQYGTLRKLFETIRKDPRYPLTIRTLTEYEAPPFPGDGTPGTGIANGWRPSSDLFRFVQNLNA